MVVNKNFTHTLTQIKEHFRVARQLNDLIEKARGEITPELYKLSKQIEAELQLLNIKIDLQLTKNT